MNSEEWTFYTVELIVLLCSQDGVILSITLYILYYYNYNINYAFWYTQTHIYHCLSVKCLSIVKRIYIQEDEWDNVYNEIVKQHFNTHFNVLLTNAVDLTKQLMITHTIA